MLEVMAEDAGNKPRPPFLLGHESEGRGIPMAAWEPLQVDMQLRVHLQRMQLNQLHGNAVTSTTEVWNEPSTLVLVQAAPLVTSVT